MTKEQYEKNKTFIELLKTLGKHIDLCYMHEDGTLMIHAGTFETLAQVCKEILLGGAGKC